MNLIIVFLASFTTTIVFSEAVTVDRRGIQPDYITRLNDNSTLTCSKFVSQTKTYTQIFKRWHCDTKKMNVTVVGQNMGCGQDLHIVGLAAYDVEKPNNKWKTCKFTSTTALNYNTDSCTYHCDCSRGCEAVMALRWPKTPSRSSWALCDISLLCYVTCRGQFNWMYKTSCYFHQTFIKSWEYARSNCRYHGGEIASIETMDEFYFLKEKLASISAYNAWVGARKIDGKYIWQSGFALPDDSPMWDPGQQVHSRNCVLMWNSVSYYLDEDDCDSRYSVLCEQNAE